MTVNERHRARSSGKWKRFAKPRLVQSVSRLIIFFAEFADLADGQRPAASSRLSGCFLSTPGTALLRASCTRAVQSYPPVSQDDVARRADASFASCYARHRFDARRGFARTVDGSTTGRQSRDDNAPASLGA